MSFWADGFWVEDEGAGGYTRTLDQVRDMVLRKLRVLGVDRTPEAEEASIVEEAINLRLAEFHRLGVLKWKLSHTLTNIALTANVATATAPTDMAHPETLAIRISGTDHPVAIVDHGRFQDIPTKSDTGIPEWATFFDRSIRFYPVPNSDYTAKLTYQKLLIETTAGSAIDVPQSCIRWLKDMVTYDISDDFRVPEQRIARLEREAEKAERKIRALLPARIDYLPVQASYF
jgi:hypothetical protein